MQKQKLIVFTFFSFFTYMYDFSEQQISLITKKPQLITTTKELVGVAIGYLTLLKEIGFNSKMASRFLFLIYSTFLIYYREKLFSKKGLRAKPREFGR